MNKNRFSATKRASINRLVKDNNVTNVEHTVAFKSWVEMGYNKGYRDAIDYLEEKYIKAYIERNKIENRNT